MSNIIMASIDNGKAFDWGKISNDYAQYRNIYPKEFYDEILELGLCKDGQIVLDIGTGTGVLPINMYQYGAKWIGTDIAPNQIAQARFLAEKNEMDIDFFACAAEEISYPDDTFDVITACQCIWYPDHKITAPKFARMLKDNGKFLILYMAWLPYDDKIAGLSEKLVLKFNPDWTGGGEVRKPIWIPNEYLEFFDVIKRKEFDVRIPFTRMSWHGRMRACRGVGASMSEETFLRWEKEHIDMLNKNTNDTFEVLHYISYAELQVK